MKYQRNISGFGDVLALQMLDFVRSLNWNVDMLVPVPLAEKRLKERGYNQVALVAEPLAYELDLEYKPEVLRKIRETPTQVGLSISQRCANVSQAYQANPAEVTQKSILLMDDVTTTGATISACTAAFLAAGAQAVYAITIARALSQSDLTRV